MAWMLNSERVSNSILVLRPQFDHFSVVSVVDTAIKSPWKDWPYTVVNHVTDQRNRHCFG